MAGQFVREINLDTFNVDVVERSLEVPVLVDFWASWCGPCRTLTPILEQLADEFAGSFELAKVNTEHNRELATQFAVRGIPAVKLFKGGRVVDEFVGALPQAAVREFLAKHIDSEADKFAAKADADAAAGDIATAKHGYAAAVTIQPGHRHALLGLARIALQAGDSDAVKAHASAIEKFTPEADAAECIVQALDLASACHSAGGIDACRKHVAEDDSNLHTRYALGACLAAQGSYEQALEEFLAVVAKDKSHHDEAARKAMLIIFGIVGIRSDLANSYRRKLSVYL